MQKLETQDLINRKEVRYLYANPKSTLDLFLAIQSGNHEQTTTPDLDTCALPPSNGCPSRTGFFASGGL